MIIKNGYVVKDVVLVDDGTLDTVFKIDGKEFRYDSEYVERTIAGGPTKAAYEMALENFLEDLNGGVQS